MMSYTYLAQVVKYLREDRVSLAFEPLLQYLYNEQEAKYHRHAGHRNLKMTIDGKPQTRAHLAGRGIFRDLAVEILDNILDTDNS